MRPDADRMDGGAGRGRVLVAGIGNVFFGDDGIRGVHLAYQLLDGYDLVVLVDVMHGDGPPGTLYRVDHAYDAPPPAGPAAASMDAHGMSPDAVLALVPALGGTLGHVAVVGCEPSTTDAGMGLSDVVEAAVRPAAEAVRAIVADAGRERKASALS